MRDWLRTVLFMSAFSPALITLAYVRYDVHGWHTDVIQLGIIGLIGSAIPFAIMMLVKKQGEAFQIQVKKVESNDFMLLAFIGSYLLPLVLKGTDVSVNAIAVMLSIAGMVLWLMSSLPAHPLMRAMKFKFYKIESSNGVVYTLVSKRAILDPRDIGLVKRISPNMLNVAVSRAKDSFLVMGNLALFDSTRKNRPSGLLATYLSDSGISGPISSSHDS